jgi:predicted secreted protein
MKSNVFRLSLTFALTFFTADATLAEFISLRLAPGARSEITLQNPTTGYVWRIEAQKSANTGIVRIEDLGFASPTTKEGARRRLGLPARINGRSRAHARPRQDAFCVGALIRKGEAAR